MSEGFKSIPSLEKKIDSFVSLEIDNKNKFKKEKIKGLCLRATESLWNDIHEVMSITGLTMNAICIDLLHREIKRKLKELKSD